MVECSQPRDPFPSYMNVPVKDPSFCRDIMCHITELLSVVHVSYSIAEVVDLSLSGKIVVDDSGTDPIFPRGLKNLA